MLDDRDFGTSRFFREAAAAIINPIQGLHRIISGDAWRVNTLNIVGRLWSTPILDKKDMAGEFGIYQHFNYYDASPIEDGSELHLARQWALCLSGSYFSRRTFYKYHDTVHANTFEAKIGITCRL